MRGVNVMLTSCVCFVVVMDTESALSDPELEADTVMIPSWNLKRKNYDTVPEGFPDVAEELLTALEEAPSGSAAGQWESSKKYLLASLAVSAVLLLAAVIGCIVMYQLRKRDTRAQEDIEASGQDWDSSWESRGLLRDETESGEGPGSGEGPQANGFRDSCRLFPEIFAAELAQLYKTMQADPSPQTTCPSCALAEGATSRDHWVSLESPLPTASWCACHQYQQEYFMFEDED
ncbi:uncharacterized protein LOC141727197 [Zonotrichia albicollis]|uniref:uncharacterized protein LOC141727068 n=1 Tax=Zonotrichia albicollis TaxID=44394 RepID=UPI003D810A22